MHRTSVAPSYSKNNDVMSPKNSKDRKSTMFVSSKTKNFEEYNKKAKTNEGGAKKNILSNLLSKFIRGGA
jgi:hypothetical protein